MITFYRFIFQSGYVPFIACLIHIIKAKFHGMASNSNWMYRREVRKSKLVNDIKIKSSLLGI